MTLEAECEDAMACPICDQKPMNCDCTDEEKRLWRQADELRDTVDRLRLTDAEQVAIEQACDEGRWYPADYHHIHTLRGLLARVRS